jgi:hypothetical protein
MNILCTELIQLGNKYPLTLAVADTLPELAFLILVYLGTVPTLQNQTFNVRFQSEVELCLSRD